MVNNYEVKKINAVIYTRYSSDKQQDQSIDGQIRVCQDYCRRHNIQVVDTYIDRALSAFKDNDKRLEFHRMINDSAKKNFEAVIVYKFDRFARDMYVSADAKFKLQKNGVRVISATESVGEGPERVLFESMYAGMAAYYSLNLSENVKRGMLESALKAQSTGGPVPLGYIIKDKKFQIDLKTAPIVRKIFEMAACGVNCAQIARQLNDEGFCNSKGDLFQKTNIIWILNNEKYTGKYKYNNIVVEDGMPALVSQELYEEAHNKMTTNVKGHKNKAAEYYLSGKLICTECDTHMVGDSSKNSTGNIYRYYTCGNKKRGEGCKALSISKEELEEVVFNNIANDILSDENIDQMADMILNEINRRKSDQSVLDGLREQKKEIEKKCFNIRKAIADGSSSQALLNDLEDLEIRGIELRDRIDDMEKTLPDFTKEQWVLFLSNFRHEGEETEIIRRKTLGSFVDSIYAKTTEDGGLELKYKLIVIGTAPITKKFKRTNVEEVCSDDNGMVGRTGFEPVTP